MTSTIVSTSVVRSIFSFVSLWLLMLQGTKLPQISTLVVIQYCTSIRLETMKGGKLSWWSGVDLFTVRRQECIKRFSVKGNRKA